MSVAFVLHGVHGGGKTFVSRPIAEDLGAKFVITDAAEQFPEVVNFFPDLRQYVYSYSALSGYSYALGLAQKGHVVFLDFGPLHSIPYIRWFLKGSSEPWVNFVVENERKVREKAKIKIVNVFFVVERDYNKVLERIRKRARPGFVNEEADPEYLRFIDHQMKELMRKMEEDGQIVESVPADAPIVEKVNRLWNIVSSYL